MLAAFIPPNHIVCLCSWGFTRLPATCNSKSFGYWYFKITAKAYWLSESLLVFCLHQNSLSVVA
ncbi:hypothetical protein DLR65_06100 [Vibrio tarriae]|nr:hypothetical protein DLR65_06100 [Vibrio tarriae]